MADYDETIGKLDALIAERSDLMEQIFKLQAVEQLLRDRVVVRIIFEDDKGVATLPLVIDADIRLKIQEWASKKQKHLAEDAKRIARKFEAIDEAIGEEK